MIFVCLGQLALPPKIWFQDMRRQLPATDLLHSFPPLLSGVAKCAGKRVWSAVQEEFKPLVQWWKELLGGEVSSVKVSRRLAKSPAIVVTGQYGWSANLERIMRAQAVAESRPELSMGKGQKVLEVNPRHPLVEELRAKVERCPGRAQH